jgi:hypothetical protein
MSDLRDAQRPLAPSRRPRERGHLALLVLFAAFALLYLLDAAGQSLRIDNLSVIAPVTVLVLLICGRLIGRILRGRGREATGTTASDSAHQALSLSWVEQHRGALFAVLLVVYLLGLVFWVFDVPTFLFLLSALWLQGERNWIAMTVFSALFAAGVCWALRVMVSFPFDTLLIATGG